VDSLYNTIFKIIFIASSSYVVYLMLNDYKPTHDPNQDTFKVQYLLAASAVLAIVFPYKYTLPEILWAFSIWLESVAILPQLFMLQRTGEAITTHYLFALGAYRALYIPNWAYRYFIEKPPFVDPIAVAAGLVQTVLYSDFFWIYYTKYVPYYSGALARKRASANRIRTTGSYKARSSTCLCNRLVPTMQTTKLAPPRGLGRSRERGKAWL